MTHAPDWLDEEDRPRQVKHPQGSGPGIDNRIKRIFGLGLGLLFCVLCLSAWWAFHPGEPRMILLDFDGQSNRALYLVISDGLEESHYGFRVYYLGSDNPLAAGNMKPYEFGSAYQSDFSSKSHPFHTRLDRDLSGQLSIENSPRKIDLSVIKQKPFWFPIRAVFMSQSALMEYTCLPASYYHETLKK